MPCMVFIPGAGFIPAGMTKSGTFTLSSTTYVQVTGWSADPGSSLSGSDLVVQSTGTATVSASVNWSNSGGFTRTVTMRLLRNGSVIATGSGVSIPTGTSADVTVSAPGQSLTAGDLIRLEAVKDFGTGNPTAGTNAGSYVRVAL